MKRHKWADIKSRIKLETRARVESEAVVCPKSFTCLNCERPEA